MTIRNRFINAFVSRVRTDNDPDIEAPADPKRPLERLNETIGGGTLVTCEQMTVTAVFTQRIIPVRV